MEITLEEAKSYLRVTSSDEDALIESLIAAATEQVQDITRQSDEEFMANEERALIRIRYLYFEYKIPLIVPEIIPQSQYMLADLYVYRNYIVCGFPNQKNRSRILLSGQKQVKTQDTSISNTQKDYSLQLVPSHSFQRF